MTHFLSVIVTTYNWPEALTKVLQALAAQSSQNFEVLVADDGSGPETLAAIEKIKKIMPVSIKHIWQEDNGFRAAAIRNRALLEARGDYIVFLDGDCIPRIDFIAQHLALAEAGSFIVGNRVLLSQAFTSKVIKENIPLHRWSIKQWAIAFLSGHCNRFLSFLSLPVKTRLRKCQTKKWQGAKGCNLAIFKADLFRVNGWEESFSGWGYEDSDLVIRLLNSGLKRKEGRFATTVIHLWHPENDRSREANNRILLEKTRASQEILAKLGLDQYKVNMK